MQLAYSMTQLAICCVRRVGKGLRSSPRDALLAASVSPERRGLAFGLHRLLDLIWIANISLTTLFPYDSQLVKELN